MQIYLFRSDDFLSQGALARARQTNQDQYTIRHCFVVVYNKNKNKIDLKKKINQ
jgi:hypothetical protein